ncbi:MAG TPA: DUF2125 domain-containing protein [Beijerinckiaceae bacterium]
MAETITTPETRTSRFWLYAPFVLLAVLALLWSAAWWVIRNRTAAGLDAWLAAEEAAGRRWTCADRGVGGYPFRVEVTCASVSLARGDLKLDAGRLLALAQVYQPRHIIAQLDGPLRVSSAGLQGEARWTLLEASFRTAAEGLQRISLFADAPSLAFKANGVDIAASGRSLEAHLRPDPSRFGPEGAFDVAAKALGTRVPALDPVLGGPEPADITLDAVVSQGRGVAGRPLPEELERWRQAGGKVDLALLGITKGPRRLETRGELRLDEGRRVAGRVEISAAGLEGLLETLTGGRAGSRLLGSLLSPPRQSSPGGQPGLAQLPPIALNEGRVFLGPFQVPGVRLAPLY